MTCVKSLGNAMLIQLLTSSEKTKKSFACKIEVSPLYNEKYFHLGPRHLTLGQILIGYYTINYEITKILDYLARTPLDITHIS